MVTFPGGDTLLRVGWGNDAINIKVVGAVLAKASKLFATMLSSEFIEGRTMDINLAEDEPQVVLDFCHIIHNGELIPEIDARRIRGLILFTDMCECQEGLKPWLLAQLGEYLRWVDRFTSYPKSNGPFPASIEGLTIGDIIAITAVWRMSDWFWKASRAYFANGEDEDCENLSLAGMTYASNLPSLDGHGNFLCSMCILISNHI